MLIFLVGMPGSGKTTAGKLLAEALMMPFFDTDSIIASIYGMTISDIINTLGETRFREMEAALIRSWKLEHAIVATGGGLPCFNDLMSDLKAKGTTIYLEITAEILAKRLHNHKDRPLIQANHDGDIREYLDKTLDFRKSYYLKSDVTVNAAQNPEEVVAEIFRNIRESENMAS